ncbi:MAG: hypothetical protein ACNA8W_25585, partial [Bradymonadaceae bacterium]
MACWKQFSRTPHRRAIRWMSSLVFCSLLTCSLPLSAQSLLDKEEVVVEAAADAERSHPAGLDASPNDSTPGEESNPQGLYVAGTMLSPILWIYLLPMTLIVFVLGAMIFHTSRRKRLSSAEGGPMFDETPRLIHLPIASLAELPVPSAQKSSAVAATSNSDVPAMQMQMLFSTAGTAKHKECPQCKRTFQTIFELCPYDATTLRPLTTNRPGARPKRTPLGRLKCSGCERRYEFGAKYCYGDGLPLVPDTNEDAA